MLPQLFCHMLLRAKIPKPYPLPPSSSYCTCPCPQIRTPALHAPSFSVFPASTFPAEIQLFHCLILHSHSLSPLLHKSVSSCSWVNRGTTALGIAKHENGAETKAIHQILRWYQAAACCLIHCNGRTETVCTLQLPPGSWWVVIWWGQKLTGTAEAQSPEQSPCSYSGSRMKEYCPLSDTSVQQPDCGLYCETNGEESEMSLLTPCTHLLVARYSHRGG